MIDVLQALIEAISESDNEIGGLRITRLATQTNEGDTSVTVETTVGFADSGRIGIDGISYGYTGRSPTSFTGITNTFNGLSTPGVQQSHSPFTAVIDLNEQFSAIDLLRGGFLVETAVDEDLTTLGRNFGVLRSPFLTDDERFRQVIQALAYNPRGTEFGLDVLLSALVGTENFEIIQDVTRPGEVFIALAEGAANEDLFQGKAWLTDEVDVVPGTGTITQLTLPKTPITVTRVQFAPVPAIGFVGGESPEDPVWERVLGQPEVPVFDQTFGAPTYQLLTNETRIALRPNQGFGDGISLRSSIRLDAESILYAKVEFAFTVYEKSADQFSFSFITNESAGFRFRVNESTANTFEIRYGASTIDTGVAFDNDYHVVELIKPDASADHFVTFDGVVFPVEPVASGIGPGSVFRLDLNAGPTGPTPTEIGFREVVFQVSGGRDYSIFKESGVLRTNPNLIETATLSFVGKENHQVILGKQNPEFPLNNGDGVFFIDTVNTPNEATVRLGDEYFGDGVGFTVFGQNGRLFFPLGFLSWPRDDGLIIRISGSQNATINSTDYIINQMFDPVTGEDLATIVQGLRQVNSYPVQQVSVSPAFPLVGETGLTLQVVPNFSGVSTTDLTKAREVSIAGNDITIPQGITADANSVVRVSFTTQLSGQLLASDVANDLVTTSPLQYTYYPFYVSDPFGAIRAYVQAITAAGVIPTFL